LISPVCNIYFSNSAKPADLGIYQVLKYTSQAPTSTVSMSKQDAYYLPIGQRMGLSVMIYRRLICVNSVMVIFDDINLYKEVLVLVCDSIDCPAHMSDTLRRNH